jgi:hypothetical protein
VAVLEHLTRQILFQLEILWFEMTCRIRSVFSMTGAGIWQSVAWTLRGFESRHEKRSRLENVQNVSGTHLAS